MQIDKKWFSNLRFKAVSGNVTNTALGTEKAVYFVRTATGEDVVLKTYLNHVGYYINEVPPSITESSLYSNSEVNSKLTSLVGNAKFDAMSSAYHKLFSFVTKMLYDKGLNDTLAMSFIADTPGAIRNSVPFLLHCPGTRRRVEELMSLTSRTAVREKYSIIVNGPYYPFKIWPGATRWDGVSVNIPCPEEYMPDLLHENPLFIWSGAILDGYLSDDASLKEAADFITSIYGPIAAHENSFTWNVQIDAIVNLLAKFVPNLDLIPVIKFCSYCGIVFDVENDEGEVLARGSDYIPYQNS